VTPYRGIGVDRLAYWVYPLRDLFVVYVYVWHAARLMCFPVSEEELLFRSFKSFGRVTFDDEGFSYTFRHIALLARPI
jgi:hypothetical protein